MNSIQKSNFKLNESEYNCLVELKKIINTNAELVPDDFENKAIQIKSSDSYQKSSTILYSTKNENVTHLLIHINTPDNTDIRKINILNNIAEFSQLRYLDLSNNNLIDIPYSINYLKKLSYLDLSGNNLSSLPNLFVNLNELSYLDLSSNLFTSLPISFGSLVSLTTLDISSNALTSLPDSFGALNNLTQLNISGNDLDNLPDSFGNLINIRILNLYDNDLRSIPNSFGNLVNLEELDMSGVKLSRMRLSYLPDSFGNLQSLKTLSLSHNRLSLLPKSFGNLTNLIKLNLSYNRLVTVNGSFGKYAKLEDLDVSHNNLSSLPEVFGCLTNLINLNLGENKLSSLPETFGNLKNLTTLNLNDNDLSSLPNSFGKLNKLVVLNLAGKDLLKLPDSFYDLENLSELNLSGNALTDISDKFCNLTKLNKVNLSGNALLSLPKCFGKLKDLGEIDLSGNDLRELPESFSELTNLTYLNLYDNDLSHLPASFGNLINLFELNLSGSSVSRMYLSNLPESFGQLSGLTSLNLSNTRLSSLPKTMIGITGLKNFQISGTPLYATLPPNIFIVSPYERIKYIIDRDHYQLAETNNSVVDYFDTPINEMQRVSDSSKYLRWLHISDLHFGTQGGATSELRDQFPPYIANLFRGKIVDCIFITGDLNYAKTDNAKSKADYKTKLVEFVKNIVSQIQTPSGNNIYIVPGNHDLKRDKVRTVILANLMDTYNSTIGIIYDEFVKKLLEGFSDFSKVYALCTENKSFPQKSPHFVIKTDKVNILHLNTALTCGGAHEDGALIIGRSILMSALHGIDKKLPMIVLAHHPFDSLNYREREKIEGLFKKNNVILYLCGHRHIARCREIKEQSEKIIYEFLCGTNMDQNSKDSSSEVEKVEMDFFIGCMDLKTCDGYVEAHSWKDNYSRWEVDTDFSLKQDSKDGRFYFPHRTESIIEKYNGI